MDDLREGAFEAGQKKELRGLRVATFESRRAKDITEMIRRRGGEPISAPAMREVPLGENKQALEFAQRLSAGKLDVVIFLTGVGTRFLAEAIEPVMSRESFANALRSITTVARGPKPVAALRELAIGPTIAVPEPNTWHELLAALDGHMSLAGKRVAVQEYGEENPELIAGLSERGASVMQVPVYKWAMPEDLGPLQEAIKLIIAGQVDIALFTTATQVEHLFRAAGSAHSSGLQKALDRVVVASIGPICSEALRRHGMNVNLEPEHPKMGHLIAAVAERGPAMVAAKRRQ
jgi:uroporphyrinogen-III synthase